MSQGGPLSSTGSGSGSPVETLTGNSGGPVPPDAAFNINVLGNNGVGIDIVGNAGTNTLTVMGLPSSTTQIGVIEIATNAETIAGTNTTKAITPDDLKAKLGTQTLHGLPIGAGTTAAIAWTAAPSDGQLLIGQTGLTPVLNTLTAGSNITIANAPGAITISSNSGAQVVNYVSVNNAASPYNALTTDYYIGADTSGGVVTIRLPNAPSTGRIFVIKDKSGTSAASAITVTTVGGVVNIDGATTYTINSAYQAISVLFNGTSYEVF